MSTMPMSADLRRAIENSTFAQKVLNHRAYTETKVINCIWRCENFLEDYWDLVGMLEPSKSVAWNATELQNIRNETIRLLPETLPSKMRELYSHLALLFNLALLKRQTLAVNREIELYQVYDDVVVQLPQLCQYFLAECGNLILADARYKTIVH